MALKEMFKGVVNSPETTITVGIAAATNSITVANANAIPAATNLLTLGGDTTSPETVKLLSVSGNDLIVERGFQGEAKSWAKDTKVSRNFTEYDHNTFIDNINDLYSIKVNTTQVLTNVPVGAKFTDTIYTHPTTAGNKHIPTGGAVGQILKNTASGTATWQNETITSIANNLTETVAGKTLDATQGKVLDDKISNLSGSLSGLEYSELSSNATNADNEGIYKNIEWRRKNNTLYAKSTLLGASPNYNQIKMEYYNDAGVTVIKTITWDIAYDNNDFPHIRTVI